MFLFLASIPIFYFYLRLNEFSTNALWQSVFITLPVAVYIYVRNPRALTGVSPAGLFTNLSLPGSIFLFIIIFIVILSIDISDLRLVRTVSREEDFLIRIINLHLVLFFLVCVYRYSSINIGIKRGGILLFFSLFLSLTIAMAEGRRTSALVPIILLSVFSLMQSKEASAFFYKALFSILIFVFVFASITYIRTPDVPIEFLIKAISSRLLNPGFIILEVMNQQNFDFNPETITNSIERIGYILGLSDYQGATNSFGRYYGFLSAENLFVGINPGIIVESFLSFGWLYIFPVVFLIEASFLCLQVYRKLLFGSDIFIAVLVLHGMQMEIPYLVGLLVKLFLAAVFLKALTVIMPLRKINKGLL
jgi:hypothetical protein